MPWFTWDTVIKRAILHASFLCRKRTWALQCGFQSYSGLWCLAWCFAGRWMKRFLVSFSPFLHFNLSFIPSPYSPAISFFCSIKFALVHLYLQIIFLLVIWVREFPDIHHVTLDEMWYTMFSRFETMRNEGCAYGQKEIRNLTSLPKHLPGSPSLYLQAHTVEFTATWPGMSLLTISSQFPNDSVRIGLFYLLTLELWKSVSTDAHHHSHEDILPDLLLNFLYTSQVNIDDDQRRKDSWSAHRRPCRCIQLVHTFIQCHHV